MLEKIRSQTDLLLLLSLLLVIVIYPLLDHDDLRRLILAALIFVPVLLATIRLSKKRGWVWPSLLLMLTSLIVAAVSTAFPIPTLVGMKWGLLTVFFGLTVEAPAHASTVLS
jgi:integral membrane sensor domain MASE1